MVRYLEASVQRWWLWLLPVILPLTTAGGLYLFSSPEYETRVTIWVDRATYLNLPNENSWQTPADLQVNLLRQLLQTRSFVMRVASETELQPYTTTDEGRAFLEEYFAKRLLVWPSGSQLISITFRTSQPALGVSILDALVRVFGEEVTTGTREQAQVAMDFYAAQLPKREEAFLASSQAVRDFLSANGGTLDARWGAAEPTESANRYLVEAQLAELQRLQDLARQRYEDTVNNLERVQLQASARETAQERGFRVIDPPGAPLQPKRSLRTLLLAPALLGAIGLAIALAVPWLSLVLDPTIRYRSEVPGRLGHHLLGTVPTYQVRKLSADNWHGGAAPLLPPGHRA